MAVNFSQDQISEFFNKEAMKETESKPKSILSSGKLKHLKIILANTCYLLSRTKYCRCFIDSKLKIGIF